MKIGVRVVIAAAVALTCLPAVPALAGPQRGVTRGQLAVQLVRAAGVQLPEKRAEQAAATALRRSGIDLGANLAVVVREIDLVRIGDLLGTRVASSQPDRTVSSGKSEAFVQALKGPLQAAVASSGTSEIHVSCQGRNSRAQRRGIPASPANPNATEPPCETEPIP
jgi:hypothetical protein